MRVYKTLSGIEISSEAFRAHNSNKEDTSVNENYNKANKLGSDKDRSLLKRIASSKHGIGGSSGKVTAKDIHNYTD